MIGVHDILLSKMDFDLAEIIVLVVLALVAIVGGAVRKQAEKREQQKHADEEQQRREQAQGSAPQAPPPVSRRVQQPMPRQAAQRFARPQSIVPQRAVAQDEISVDEEVRSRQRRRKLLDQKQQERLSARQPTEADTAAIESRLLSIKPATIEPAQQLARPRIRVDLRAPQNAREMMIYHELLSPPKALRTDPESWET